MPPWHHGRAEGARMAIPRLSFMACVTAMLVDSSSAQAAIRTVLRGEWQIHWNAAEASAHNVRTGVDWLIFPNVDASCASCEMLSLVGSLVSFRNSAITTYDLDTGEPAALSDCFASNDLVTALLTDKRVLHAVATRSPRHTRNPNRSVCPRYPRRVASERCSSAHLCLSPPGGQPGRGAHTCRRWATSDSAAAHAHRVARRPATGCARQNTHD